MKKILSLLGAIGLVASTGATSVVSCGSPKNDSGSETNSEISALTKKWDGMTFDDFFTEFNSKADFKNALDEAEDEKMDPNGSFYSFMFSKSDAVPIGFQEDIKNVFTADNLQYINYFIDRCNKDGKTNVNWNPDTDLESALSELQATIGYLQNYFMDNLKNVTKDTFLQNLYDKWNPVLQKAKFTNWEQK